MNLREKRKEIAKKKEETKLGPTKPKKGVKLTKPKEKKQKGEKKKAQNEKIYESILLQKCVLLDFHICVKDLMMLRRKP